MRILVTGANGFTGVHFQKVAKAAGHNVIPLEANLTHRDELKKEVAEVEPEAVVHFGGISYVGHAEEPEFYNVNVFGTANLLASLVELQKRPEKVLLASSANIYGDAHTGPITEYHGAQPVNHYANSKTAMELLAQTYLSELSLIIARPFNYTGLGQSSQFLIPKLVQHFAAAAPSINLGNIAVEREFNDVRSVVEVYLLLLTKGSPSEVFNICSGRTYSLAVVIKLLEELTGHKLEINIDRSGDVQ